MGGGVGFEQHQIVAPGWRWLLVKETQGPRMCRSWGEAEARLNWWPAEPLEESAEVTRMLWLELF